MVHTFCRAIGFSELKENKQLYQLLEDVIQHPDKQTMAEDPNGNEFACFSKNMGGEFGISVCGNFIAEDEFHMEYYYPYFTGSHITTTEQIELEQHASKQAYAGICDEARLGIALIFYISNIVDVLHEMKISNNRPNPSNSVLSGLATNGMILLPVAKTEKQQKRDQQRTQKRLNLIQQAREGDRTAIESLTMSDMDTYSAISKRIMREDILSIVETSFIPYGIESDQYVIIGEILNYYKIQNTCSNEWIWVLSIECNKMQFDVCINEKDLMGQPEIGRRFKGRVWLQGHLNFGY